ncbi:MAG: substrate-binding domain-containing protein [Pseudomonadota bacterium]|nr:substrate-binding domain-containing protein [Pseudomonadota bacterium]
MRSVFIIPGEATAKVLSAFRDRFPTVTLELLIEGLGAVTQKLLSEEASIGIGGPVTSEHPALERRRLGEVALIPVAAPDHPLARAIADGEDIIGQSRQHLQLVLADRSDLTEGREFSVISPHTWRLGDLGAKHSLLKEGLGWGNMPRAMIAEDLANGTLVELDLPEAPGANYSLTGLWLRKAQPRPAGRWLMDEFEKQLARCA